MGCPLRGPSPCTVMNWPVLRIVSAVSLLVVGLIASDTFAQIPTAEPSERMQSLSGNFFGQTARPLRYFPVGRGFVITNGTEFFNRPLYCLNSAMRVDGG